MITHHSGFKLRNSALEADKSFSFDQKLKFEKMKLLMIVAFLFIAGKVFGQELFQRVETVEAGIFIHSFGMPFVGDDFLRFDHLPGFSAAANLPLTNKGKWQTDYRLRFSGYIAKGLHKGLHLSNQIVESYQPTQGFRLEGIGGLGYLHTFEDAALFKQHDGAYKPKRDWGRPQFTLSVGLGFSIRLGRNSPYWFFAEQQLMIQLPFAAKSGVSVLTHNRSYFGLRREINRKFRAL